MALHDRVRQKLDGFLESNRESKGTIAPPSNHTALKTATILRLRCLLARSLMSSTTVDVFRASLCPRQSIC